MNPYKGKVSFFNQQKRYNVVRAKTHFWCSVSQPLLLLLLLRFVASRLRLPVLGHKFCSFSMELFINFGIVTRTRGPGCWFIYSIYLFIIICAWALFLVLLFFLGQPIHKCLLRNRFCGDIADVILFVTTTLIFARARFASSNRRWCMMIVSQNHMLRFACFVRIRVQSKPSVTPCSI